MYKNMRAFIAFVFVITYCCVGASDAKDVDNLMTSNNQRSLKYFGEEPNAPYLEVEKNNGRVTFEDYHHKALDNPHFFPIDNTGNVNTDIDNNAYAENYVEEIPLYDDDKSDSDNLEDIEEEQIFTKFENNYNEEIAGTGKENTDTYKNKDNGRVVFEHNGEKERKPITDNKRKARRRPENKVLIPPNGFDSGLDNPSHPGYSYDNQHSTSYTNAKGPGYHSYQTGYSGHNSYPGHRTQKKPRPLTKPVVSASHSDTTAEVSGENAPPGRPAERNQQGYSGYLPQSGYPGYISDANSQYGQNGHYPYPITGHRRPPKSLTQQAVSSVAEALTSIALYDDKQCIPRLLCEVASGRSAGSSTMLKATAGIGPLLSILQSYNTASSSPLFVFARAAVLGVTSVGNIYACRRAYPQCPNDPTELINYLNNHNGGFFRFFGQPGQPKIQQNLEQFYNQLVGQIGNQQQTQQQQSYASNYYQGTQNLYPNNKRKYDSETHRFKDSKVLNVDIRERILNKPDIDIINDESIEEGSKWSFPDEVDNSNKERKPRRSRTQKAINPNKLERLFKGERGGSPLKFPDDRRTTEDRLNTDKEKDFRKQKAIYFPGGNLIQYGTNYQTNSGVNQEDFVFDYKHNFYVRRPKQVSNTIDNDDGLQTVYIVRGNGDPNHPEIVKVRPGQSI